MVRFFFDFVAELCLFLVLFCSLAAESLFFFSLGGVLVALEFSLHLERTASGRVFLLLLFGAVTAGGR